MPELLGRLQSALADRYRLDREIGAGGMATVYLAEDVRHDRRVALKVLRPELAAVIGAERFLAEIKLTANLQHPHILPLFDSGEADGYLFYVMPFVEGETLRDRLNREKQLPVADAVRITIEVASALDYAHRHGVVHRDIKPENILLHDGSALVADFGIALAASKASGARMTETGMSLGTPHYMSPEQAMGEREITARSDVYALGAVLYEMLTGEPPFTGATAQAVVARVLTESPRPLMPAAPHHPAARRGGGAHRAREAPGRPVRHGRRVRRRAQGQVVRLHRVAPGRGRPSRSGPRGAAPPARRCWCRRSARRSPSPRPRRSGAGSGPAPARLLTQFSLALRPNQTLQPPLADRRRADRALAGRPRAGVQRARRRRDPPLAPAARPARRHADRGHRGRRRARSSPPTASGSDSSRTGRAVRIASLAGAPTVTLTDKANTTSGDWGDDGYIYFEVDSGVARMRATGGEIEPVYTISPEQKEIATEWVHVLPGATGRPLPAPPRGAGPGRLRDHGARRCRAGRHARWSGASTPCTPRRGISWSSPPTAS